MVRIVPDANEVIVGEEKYLYNKQFFIDDINWLSTKDYTQEPVKTHVRMRSMQEPVLATIEAYNHGAIITLDTPQKAIAKGQAAVFYEGTHVLGGGWIREVIP